MSLPLPIPTAALGPTRYRFWWRVVALQERAVINDPVGFVAATLDGTEWRLLLEGIKL